MHRRVYPWIAVTLLATGSATAQEPPALPPPEPQQQEPAPAPEVAPPPTTTPAPEATPLAVPADVAPAPEAPAPPNVNKDKQAPPQREIRDGVVLGFDVGFGLAKANGFPNDPKSIGVESTFSRTNTMIGAPYTFLLQGSIHDQVNFGLMVHIASYTSERWRSSGGAVGFRVDGFPFMKLVPAIRDVGLFGAAGVGFSKLSNKADLGPDADTVQSFLSLGAFYEYTLLKLSGSHVAVGPQLSFDTVFSRNYGSQGGTASMRLVFYTGK